MTRELPLIHIPNLLCLTLMLKIISSLSNFSNSAIGTINISPDFIQPNDHRTKGFQRLRQLQATNDTYKCSFYPRTISDWNRLPTPCHRPPDSSGIQGSPCRPVSTTPDVQLIPLQPVHSFILGDLGVLSAFIGHRSFKEGNLQSEEDYCPYLGGRRRRRNFGRHFPIFITETINELVSKFNVGLKLNYFASTPNGICILR